jgi:hypothetical protein
MIGGIGLGKARKSRFLAAPGKPDYCCHQAK